MGNSWPGEFVLALRVSLDVARPEVASSLAESEGLADAAECLSHAAPALSAGGGCGTSGHARAQAIATNAARYCAGAVQAEDGQRGIHFMVALFALSAETFRRRFSLQQSFAMRSERI